MEETKIIPRKILFGNPEKTMPQLSSDGKLIGFLAPFNGILNVWVGPSDDISKAKPITNDTQRGITNFYFAYTNRHILYLQDKDGNEQWHVFCANLDDNKITDLTPIVNGRAEISTLSERFPEKVVLLISDRNESFSDIYICDITTGEKKMILHNDEYLLFNIDNDYNIRFMYKQTEDGGTQVYIQSSDGEISLYDTIPFDDALTTYYMSFDKSQKNVYLVDSRNRNTSALYLKNIESKTNTLIAENKKSDYSDLTIHPIEKNIQAVAFTYEKKNWMILDETIKSDFAYLESQSDGELEIVSRTLSDDKWLVHFSTDNKSATYFIYDRTEKELKKLFTTRPELENFKLAKMHPVTIKSKDNFDLVCYYTLPSWTGTKIDCKPDYPLPMIVNVHGGPWARDFWGYNSLHQWFANRGYVVLSVNFRSSTGFGKDFINAGNGEWGGKMHQDVLDAIEWAIKEGIADVKKICIFGGSYGGYETLVGITFSPDRFSCAVDLVGPSNLITFMNSIPAYWKPLWNQFTRGLGGDPNTEEGNKFLAERSPINHINNIKTPLLIGHGKNDPRVKVAESEQIADAMKSKNIPVTYALYPNEGHGFVKPENRISFFAVVEKFIAKFLGGRFEDIGDSMTGSSITVPVGIELVEGLKEAISRAETNEKV